LTDDPIPLGVLYAEYEIELWDSALGTASIGDDPGLDSGDLWEYTFPGVVSDGTDVASSTDSYGVWILNGIEGAGPMTPTGGSMDELLVTYSNDTHTLTVIGWPYTQVAVEATLKFFQDETIARSVTTTFQDPVSGVTNLSSNAFWTSTTDHVVQFRVALVRNTHSMI
jgi:hypothetical protein